MHPTTPRRSLLAALVASGLPVGTPLLAGTSPPDLAPGVWTNIGPTAVTSVGYGTSSVTLDPSNPRILYMSTDELGLWRSVDGGSTWLRMGNPASIGFPTTGYLDVPIRVAVDPANPQHLYATDGVRGSTMGFWVSTNGGTTWTMPQGFRDSNTTYDVTSMFVDPADFNHIVVGSHSPWPGLPNAGVLESRDGGVSWTAHPPVASWPAGSMGVSILHHPASGTGNADTWLVGTDGNGFWRTVDAGAHWTQVAPTINVPHGGHQIYYTSSGVLYAGATPYAARSFDNGVTWQSLTNLPFTYYFSVYGDGHRLYTLHSYPTLGGFDPAPFFTSLESDGADWQPYQGGAQMFTNGPATMAFDGVNGILYGAMWNNGLFALKVLDWAPADLLFADGFE
jgi:hypothetical protein